MNATTAFVLGLLAFAATSLPAAAQDGCKAAQSSCTQLNTICEQKCQGASNNASACIARSCAATLSTCKSTGLWKPPGSAGCWKTSNRS